MTAAKTGLSRTARVYLVVRADIVAGNYVPGQRLRPAELATANEVSLNVAREALNRLAGEGLVSATPHRGFTVTEVSIHDLEDLTAVRLLVEVVALRQSIEDGDLSWETDVVAAHHRLAHTPIMSEDEPGPVSREWMRVHNEFHATTMAGCGNRRLTKLAASLGESAAIYRYSFQHYDHGRRDIPSEHRAIFEATLDRDADRACRLHVEHIERTAQIVTSALSAEHPSDE